MSGINDLFEIGKRALFSYKTALNVVGHNVANINTPGYSKQEAVFEAVSHPQGLFGSTTEGVDITTIKRNYDKFIDMQINQEMHYSGRWNVVKNALDQIEAIFNESSGRGLGATMDEFWAAWQELTNRPDGMPERINLSNSAETLVDVVSRMDSDLERVQKYADRGILDVVDEINSLTSGIAGINRQIVAAEAGDHQANDLRDQRGQLLQQLADRVDISYFEDQDGSLTVYLGGSTSLVEGDWAANLKAVSGQNGLHRVDWVGPTGNQVEVTGKLTNGSLGGWIEVRDSIVPKYGNKLDELASTLIKEVNKLHSSGVGLDPFQTVTSQSKVADSTAALASSSSGLPFYSEIGNGSFELWVYDDTGALVNSQTISVDSSTTLQGLQGTLNGINGISASITADGRLKVDSQSGWSFHLSNDTSGALMALGLNTMFTGSGATDMALNESVRSDPNRIAAAVTSDGANIAAGNNLNAVAIAQLQDSMVMENNSMAMADFYQSAVALVGTEAASAKQNLEYEDTILGQLNNRRQAVSGVSLDEEVVSLMEYTKAYNAAAKLITMAQNMMDVLLQMTD